MTIQRRWLFWSVMLHFIALALVFFNAKAHAGNSNRFIGNFQWNVFYKGNTHTHSNRSDGDSAPSVVVRWYRDHGYNFLVLTDHNHASDPQEFMALENDHFKTISGEEVSFASHVAPGSSRLVSVHVNSICAQGTVRPQVIDPVSDSLQTAISEVISTPGTLAQINHPNFEWALTYADIFSSQGASLMEVANQHPFVNNEGNSDRPSTEVLWDRLLSNGFRIYGVASDDMHDLTRDPGFTPRRPGQGWVQVAADRNEPREICDAMGQGKFYFSNGVELNSIEVADDRLNLLVRGDGASAESFHTQFIGRNGEVLAEQTGLSPSYTLRGNELYVRAKVNHTVNRVTKSAWIQPVRALVR